MSIKNGRAVRRQSEGRLLSPEERKVCKRVATGSAPYCQRALALLALDQGVTQAEAGELSGLTKGQVRYWRDKFLQQSIGIFPGIGLDQEEKRAMKKKLQII